MSDLPPGLLIIRDEGHRECYTLVHEPSGVPLIFGLAGQGSATGAALEAGDLTDWAVPARRLLTVLESRPEVLAGLERAAARWGGTTRPLHDGKAAA